MDFIAQMNQEHDDLTRLKPQHRRGAGESNLVTLTKPKFVFSKGPSIRRRVLAVQAARHRAEELKVIERSDTELVAELESLRANLPTIDGELEPVVGE